MAEDMDEQTMHLLRKTFAVADKTKSGGIDPSVVMATLSSAGLTPDPAELEENLSRIDLENGKVSFSNYVLLAASFMEEEDEETIINELMEAFRLYDKEGNGYITIKVLKEILKELDNKITEKDMDEIIEDIDEGKKGKIDFANFKALML